MNLWAYYWDPIPRSIRQWNSSSNDILYSIYIDAIQKTTFESYLGPWPFLSKKTLCGQVDWFCYFFSSANPAGTAISLGLPTYFLFITLYTTTLPEDSLDAGIVYKRKASFRSALFIQLEISEDTESDAQNFPCLCWKKPTPKINK